MLTLAVIKTLLFMIRQMLGVSKTFETILALEWFSSGMFIHMSDVVGLLGKLLAT